MNKTVVSLIAHATEIVFYLNRHNFLLGRSHGCDFPSEISSLPVLTKATFPLNGTSLEIDSHVKGKLSGGLSVYEINEDLLAELAPDVILTQDQCDVCAASLQDVEDAVCSWIGKKAEIVSLKPDALADVFSDIERVAVALGVAENGTALVRSMKERMYAIRSAVEAKATYRPRVACIEWIEPLMTAGNWVPELIDMAGGINLFGEPGKHSPWMEWDALIEADPEVIFVFPCGFGIERSMQEFSLLERHEGWSDMRAVREGQVYVIDGNQYCNRPGPRLVETLEIFSEILHSDIFNFKGEGVRWVRRVVP